MNPDVSIVTVTFGDRPAAVRVGTGLEAVQRTGGDPPAEVIVVAVGPAGREAAEQLVEHTAGTSLQPVIVDVEEGAGYARAANAGVAKSAGDIVVVAKPEVTFHQRFLKRLRIEAPETWDFLAPAVREGEAKEPTGTARRGPGHRMVGVRPPRQASPVQAGSDACVILRRTALERRLSAVGGLFEEEYGSGSTDLDLFWWAEREGLVVRYVPNLYVGFAVGRERWLESEQHRRDMAAYRVSVWKHARRPGDWAAWLLGETSYVGEAFTARRLGGLNHYLASWQSSLRMVRTIKQRRGKLRV